MKENPTRQTHPHWPRVVLRRTDQAVVAVFVAAALAAMAAWWGWQRWFGGGLIDIERAEPLAVEFKIDVNKADWPELALMPNIGEQLAKRIVAYRLEHGPFRDMDELDRVSGIGPKTLESMRPYLLPLASESAFVQEDRGTQLPVEDH